VVVEVAKDRVVSGESPKEYRFKRESPPHICLELPVHKFLHSEESTCTLPG